MLFTLTHKSIGQIRFNHRDQSYSTGLKIRGAELYASRVFIGEIIAQQFLSNSYTIAYIDFGFNKNALLEWSQSGLSLGLLFVLEGRLKLLNNGEQPLELSKGAYLLRDKPVCQLGFYESDKASVLSISIPEDAYSLINTGEHPFLNRVLRNSPGMNSILDDLFRNEYNQVLRSLFYEKCVRDLFFQHFLAIENSNMVVSGNLIPPSISMAYDLILKSNPDTHYSLADLAELTGVSASTLKKGFKKYFGSSPFAHQADLRMEWVRGLIENTNLPIKKIFKTAGYAHVAGFIKAFKKEYGLSPFQWRKKHRTN